MAKAKSTSKKTKEKNSNNFLPSNKYSPRTELIETRYEDIPVIQFDGSVVIQKNVPVYIYRIPSPANRGISVGSNNDDLERLDSNDDTDDEIVSED